MQPFKVEVIDSAGAGDSFRGGLIYAMLQGWSDEKSVRFACATAALICTTAPGCVNPPSLEQVMKLHA
jgi:sugar/nucleoside kinase (ribokinase family)